MAFEPELVEVVCRRCGTVSTTYLRPHVDHEPELMHPEDGDGAPRSCPECGTPFEDEAQPGPSPDPHDTL